MKTRVYVGLFLTFFFTVTLTLMTVSLWIGGYDGDLTRIGGLSERQYGWNRPLNVFLKDHTVYHILYSRGEYSPADEAIRANPDILVFGDSFSHLPIGNQRRNYAWPSYLYEHFGLTTYVYHLESDSVLDWLDQHDPDTWPDTIVYERVQGRLKAFEALQLPPRQCTIDMTPTPYHAPPLLPQPSAMKTIDRGGESPFQLDTAIYWLNARLNPIHNTFQFPLTRNDLFSHNHNDHILVNAGYFQLDDLLSDTNYRNVACYLWQAKQKAESNGRTQFIIAIVPDKFTAYEPYIDTDQTTDNAYTRLQAQGLYVYRFDRYFRDQIARSDLGPDIYLPNDSHWGPTGSRLFASAIYALMQQ